MSYLALFFTQSGAIKFSRAAAVRGISSEMQAVPRKLSASCGTAVKFFYEGDVNTLITEDIERLYEIKGREYNLLYDAKS